MAPSATKTTRPTRERILDNALRLFAERGYEATSIGEIEVAAGLVPRSGALYKHFASKRALIDVALAERVGAIDSIDERQLPASRPVTTGLLELFRANAARTSSTTIYSFVSREATNRGARGLLQIRKTARCFSSEIAPD